MLENEIKKLQGKLNEMICNKRDNNLIYDLSTQLDELIVSYYKDIKLRSN